MATKVSDVVATPGVLENISTQIPILKAHNKSERCRGNTRRIREHIYTDTHTESPQQKFPFGMVVGEKKEDINIRKRRCTIKKVNVI